MEKIFDNDIYSFLESSNIQETICKNNILIDDSFMNNIEKLFNIYGREKSIDIAASNPFSFLYMLKNNKVDLLTFWYDRLKKLPDKIIIENFKIDDIDKYKNGESKWVFLSNIERYNSFDDLKLSLLNACFAFGVFDNDEDGFNSLVNLLVSIPKRINKEDYKKIKNTINNIDIDSFYKFKDDYYVLRNFKHSKSEVKDFRELMEQVGVYSVLTPSIFKDIFFNFEMKYSYDFKKFLLKNMEEILSSFDGRYYIGKIQNRWDDIESFTNISMLSLDNAINYIKDNIKEECVFDKHDPSPFNDLGSTSNKYIPIIDKNISSDDIKIFDDSNTTYEDLLYFKNLEKVTPQNKGIINNIDDDSNLITAIAHKYGFLPERTKIIAGYKFAIVYSDLDDRLVIGDVFFDTLNDKDSNKVLVQLKMAIDQLTVNGKIISIEKLSQSQLGFCDKALSIDKNDIDRINYM